jgi:hypothetical protein
MLDIGRVYSLKLPRKQLMPLVSCPTLSPTAFPCGSSGGRGRSYDLLKMEMKLQGKRKWKSVWL